MQEQDRVPMLVEMGRVPAYAPPVYYPADQEPEEGKLVADTVEFSSAKPKSGSGASN